MSKKKPKVDYDKMVRDLTLIGIRANESANNCYASSVRLLTKMMSHYESSCWDELDRLSRQSIAMANQFSRIAESAFHRVDVITRDSAPGPKTNPF